MSNGHLLRPVPCAFGVIAPWGEEPKPWRRLYKDGNLKDPVTSGRIVESIFRPARKTAATTYWTWDSRKNKTESLVHSR